MEYIMFVSGLILDPVTKSPVVILKDESESRMLPIWIGLFEANAIAFALEKIEPPRPMTHDLLKDLVDKFNAQLVRIVVEDIRDNTYYASLILEIDGIPMKVDSRPSDAIALALRCSCPIYVSSTVFKKAKTKELEENDWEDSEKVKEWLADLNPEDFSKYEM